MSDSEADQWVDDDDQEAGAAGPSNDSRRKKIQRPRRRGRYNVLSKEQKALLVRLVNEGHTIKDAALSSNMKLSTAKSVYQKYKCNDWELKQRSRGGITKQKLSSNVLNAIEEIVESNSGYTLKQIKGKLSTQNINISLATIHRGLCKLKITLKKAAVEVDKMNSRDSIEKRRIFALEFDDWVPEDRSKLIFIDESGFNYHLRRSQARSKINTRAVITVPTVRGRNTTLILAMNNQRVLYCKVIKSGNCNSSIFKEFLTELFEVLEQEELHGSFLIMDNAAIHKTREVKLEVEEKQHLIKYLPPYSPTLNPVEHAFSKIKASTRRLLADNSIRVNDLAEAISCSVNEITTTDCANYVMELLIKLPSAAAGVALH